MKWLQQLKAMVEAVWGFFPVQLLLAHLKRNIILLFLWFLLFGFTLGHIGKNYGISNLLLAPEYLGKVNFNSFLILGWAFGGFALSFQLLSYMIQSRFYPLIATFSRPFLKYVLNNSLIPLVYFVVFAIQSVNYQQKQEFIDLPHAYWNIAGFIAGFVIHWILAFGYFFTTNFNIEKYEKKFKNVRKKRWLPKVMDLGHPNFPTHYIPKDNQKVKYYLTFNLKILHAREIKHYDRGVLEKILDQNRFNVSFYQIIVLFSMMAIGYFSGAHKFLQIPAGAAIYLLFTVLIIVAGIFYSLVKEWSTFVLIASLVLFSYLSKQEIFSYVSRIPAISYETKRKYNEEHFKIYADETTLLKDKTHAIKVLNRWKANNVSKPEEKPVIVFVNTSGGGIRSALWTHRVLRTLDSLTNGKFSRATFMITGSSGGMIGAAIYRELYLYYKLGYNDQLFNPSLEQISGKDLLNPVLLNLTTNDWFVRLRKIRFGNKYYLKDRGLAFEKQLIENTNGLLSRQLSDYKVYEEKALIPWLVLAPVIVEDGKQLIISSQPVSYLCAAFPFGQEFLKFYNESVEFSKLFGEDQCDSLWLTSALRMSASFPLILPSVDLPTDPHITVNDAGLRDNFGLNNSMKFIATFKSWLESNVSKIILINIRDIERNYLHETKQKSSVISNLFLPINSLYDNLFLIQDYNNLQMLRYIQQGFQIPVELIPFEITAKHGEVSMSFHLTKNEKQKVVASIYHPKNKKSLDAVVKLFNDKINSNE